ncbi:MAG: pyridoxamine 5'-phosphate oxidase family protein [Rickettsiales bacterium]
MPIEFLHEVNHFTCIHTFKEKNMVAVRDDSESREKVWDLIKDIKVALLVTHGEDEKLHARPMVAANERIPTARTGKAIYGS